MSNRSVQPTPSLFSQSEIESYTRIVRQRFNESLVKSDRFREATCGHRFFGLPRLQGEFVLSVEASVREEYET